MNFSIQTPLETSRTRLDPLEETDFERLFAVASDPKIWAQHPNKDRWREAVFTNFFQGAMQSGGAFIITEKKSGKAMGSTRFYNYNAQENSLFIGYTFFAHVYWGKGYNAEVKTAMLDFIFQFVSKVYLHIGANNIPSQISITRLGAEKIGEEQVAYYGEPSRHNFVYTFLKEKWLAGK